MAITGLRIGPADQGRRMTLEEFRDAEGLEGYRYELARGVLEVVEVPDDRHGQVVDNAHEILSSYRRQHPGLIVRIAHGSDIRLVSPELESNRHPDLAVVFSGSGRDARGRQVPALVIEVVSPGGAAQRRDYEEKRREYLALGIREYWIVDPQVRQVVVLIRRGGEDQATWAERVFRGEERIGSELLPGLAVEVGPLWTDVNRDETDANGPG